MKTCTCCKAEKPFESFYKKHDSKDGRATACIECRKIKKRAEYLSNRSAILARVKDYREANPEKVALSKKNAYDKKPDHYIAKGRARYTENRESILLQMADYRAANPEIIKARQKDYNFKNREAKVEKQKVYYLQNKEQVREYHRRYNKERMKLDPLYALSAVVRRRISLALSRYGCEKRTRTTEMLGCSYADLRDHLEKQFHPGMSWENRGEWHIDHIIPLASAKTEYELLGLCHFSNLQPLWAFDNMSKGARILAKA